jgi:ferritin
MSYIDRDKDGRITGKYTNPQFEGQEFQEVAEIWLDHKDAIRAQIKKLEQEQLMPRATREFMLLFMESQFPANQLAQSIGYTGMKAFDNQIKALRDQL